MPCRLYVPVPLQAGAELSLPPEAARHVQVLRLQPGDELILFNGQGGQWQAEVQQMGRKEVAVRLRAALPDPANELPLHITLAMGMPANERMDSLVEKATELGVAALQPLQCARSVLKLQGERADKRRAHWQGVAIAASEQSGRTQVPDVAPVAELKAWLSSLPRPAAPAALPDGAGLPEWRGLLSLAADAQPLARWAALGQAASRITLLSGPEGGLAPEEEALARSAGFVPLSLGRRVLRADTAPLAALAAWGVMSGA
jgi:16S rRNA (uracil1498-N3)-methyltransferase